MAISPSESVSLSKAARTDIGIDPKWTGISSPIAMIWPAPSNTALE